MIIRRELRLPGGTLLIGWLALCGCQHNDNPPPERVIRPATGPWTPTEERLYADISWAHLIENHEYPWPRPDQPVNFDYGKDSSYRSYHYANLRAFRIDIKRRMDSLQRAGVELSYDTVEMGPVTHGRLREVPEDSIPILEQQLRDRKH